MISDTILSHLQQSKDWAKSKTIANNLSLQIPEVESALLTLLEQGLILGEDSIGDGNLSDYLWKDAANSEILNELKPWQKAAAQRAQISELASQEFLITRTEYLLLEELTIDLNLQSRAKIDWKHVAVLKEEIIEGKELDAIEVVRCGETNYLAHGFHRYYAAKDAKLEGSIVKLREGSYSDAIELSVSANATNKPQLPRTPEDKRRAVTMALADDRLKLRSDRE
ncbi:MAG: hypothetical protein ACRC8K_23630, partial [Waterburya sp.]